MNVLLQGGLGNTMFQWAFGRSLSLRRGLPLSFDRSELDKDQKPKTKFKELVELMVDSEEI
jgi:hypothetical protein